MAIPTEPTVYIGSHIKANVGYGTSGDPSASSLEPGQKIKRSPEGKVLADRMDATVPGSDANPGMQTRTISAAPLAPAHGMRSRSGEGGKIPSVTDRGGGQRAALTNAMNRGRR
jgi:hypothetical protein